MKTTFRIALITLVAALVPLRAFAEAPTRLAATAQDSQCTPENKLAWYNEFRSTYNKDNAKANELAKKWLACPEAAGEERITSYLKNFIMLYEKAYRKARIPHLVYATNDYPKAIELAKAVLADEPDNLKVLIDFVYAGYASKSEAHRSDTLTYAKKAIRLIESGMTLENWSPYRSKEETLGYLYNAVGALNVQRNPGETLPTLIKAAQFEGKIKTLPHTYAMIAEAYETGPYAKLSEEYKAKYGGKNETAESKLALEKINQVIDRMIDAYARAVALAGNDPQYQTAKKAWLESLTIWYKFRHNESEVGLNEMIAGILAKPLPPMPTPISKLPAPAPTSSPTPGAATKTG